MKAKLQQGTVIAVCFGSLLWASAAYADGWPTTVQGNWSVVANQTSGTLSITQPSSTLNCKPISGLFSQLLRQFKASIAPPADVLASPVETVVVSLISTIKAISRRLVISYV